MKDWIFSFIFSLFGGLVAFTLVSAQEKITLTTAEITTTNTYEIVSLTITSDNTATTQDEGLLRIELRGMNNEQVNCTYSMKTNPTATTLIIGLNKANLSSAYNNNATTGSLKQRINHRLVIMGESTQVCGKTLTGTLTGSPQ